VRVWNAESHISVPSIISIRLCLLNYNQSPHIICNIECTYPSGLGVTIVQNITLCSFGYPYYPTDAEYIFETIVSTNSYNLLDMISISVHTDHHIQMEQLYGICQIWTNRFIIPGTDCELSQPEPLNIVKNIDSIAYQSTEPLKPEFRNWSNIQSSWNL